MEMIQGVFWAGLAVFCVRYLIGQLPQHKQRVVLFHADETAAIQAKLDAGSRIVSITALTDGGLLILFSEKAAK